MGGAMRGPPCRLTVRGAPLEEEEGGWVGWVEDENRVDAPDAALDPPLRGTRGGVGGGKGGGGRGQQDRGAGVTMEEQRHTGARRLGGDANCDLLVPLSA